MKTKTILVASLAALTAFAVSCNTGSNKAASTDTAAVKTQEPAGKPVSTFNAGSFKGNIPGGAAKVNVVITFATDSAFTMSEEYLDKNGKPGHTMSTKGKWKYDDGAKKIYLVYENLADRGTSFTVVDEKTIQMHDGSMQTKTTQGAEYNLKRE